ncbi:MAG: hypothetical protein M3Q56_11740 [Bacteroidota bacterium]|nr:hypothetical protein [Bacteroidota bacterium]
MSDIDRPVEIRQRIIFRLTALWALSEAGLGGFLHALKIPVTGLIVGGLSMILITLISYFSKEKRTLVFKALMLVLLVKLSLSPHTSPTAYLAVSFQAGVAYIIYKYFHINRVSITLVFVLGYFETAAQKLIMLTILGGKPFWNAVDDFVTYIATIFNTQIQYSGKWYLMGVYFGIYLIAAVVLAALCYALIKQFSTDLLLHKDQPSSTVVLSQEMGTDKPIKKRIPKWMSIFLIIAIAVAYILFSQQTDYVYYRAIQYLLRTFLIILFWYFIVMPYSLKWINKFLKSKLPQHQSDIEDVVQLFPKMKEIIKRSWIESHIYKGIFRLFHFIKLSIYNILVF